MKSTSRSLKKVILGSLVILSLFCFSSLVLAEEKKPQVKEEVVNIETQVKPAIKKVEKAVTEVKEIKENIKEEIKPATKALEQVAKEECKCDKPALDALHNAYNSLEEDEWEDAIKECKKSLLTIEETEKKCKCPSIAHYKKILNAYLSYAQGGQILDGDEDIDCPRAKKYYEDAIKTLKDTSGAVSQGDIKTEVQNITDYCEEEIAFVNDECE